MVYTGLLQDSGFSTSYITDTKKRGEYKKKVYDALIKEKKKSRPLRKTAQFLISLPSYSVTFRG